MLYYKQTKKLFVQHNEILWNYFPAKLYIARSTLITVHFFTNPSMYWATNASSMAQKNVTI